MCKFFVSIPKVLFAVICYLSALLLAILSGYFTVMFYSESQTGLNMYAMTGLACMLEFIKVILSIAYPFLQYRDSKREKKVLFYLRVCFLLSVMASLNFFFSGGSIQRSPASKISELIYTYIPVFKIIPLSFTQFITTMSLSILVEAFIIFLPVLAPIMFLQKDYSRKKENTSFEKLKEIIVAAPERFIDRLHKKVVIPDEIIEVKEVSNKQTIDNTKEKKEKSAYNKDLEDKKLIEKEMSNKPNLKVVSSIDNTKEKKKESTYNKDTENKINETIDYDKFKNDNWKNTNKKDVLKAIYDNSENGEICPSITNLVEITKLKRLEIQEIKREFEDSGIIETKANKTYIKMDSYTNALKILKGGGVKYGN